MHESEKVRAAASSTEVGPQTGLAEKPMAKLGLGRTWFRVRESLPGKWYGVGGLVARLLAAMVLGILLLACQAALAVAGGLAKTTDRAAGQAGSATVHSNPQPLQDAESGHAIVPGFNSSTYGPNDDGSYPCTGPDDGVPEDCTPTPIPLPFTANFYGTVYSSVYLNNNGNLTFGAPLSEYTPESLNQISVPLIAPFWADVDTRTGPTVTYGDGTVDGHRAFGVNWLNVGCYDKTAQSRTPSRSC